MSGYWIIEVDGIEYAAILNYLNAQAPEHFPALDEKHLRRGYWWLAYAANRSVVGFAGMVPMHPFDGVWYLKRAYVLPAHRGHSLQLILLRAREAKARECGIRQLVSECAGDNQISARNFIRAGFEKCEPEQRWGAAGSTYFSKCL